MSVSRSSLWGVSLRQSSCDWSSKTLQLMTSAWLTGFRRSHAGATGSLRRRPAPRDGVLQRRRNPPARSRDTKSQKDRRSHAPHGDDWLTDVCNICLTISWFVFGRYAQLELLLRDDVLRRLRSPRCECHRAGSRALRDDDRDSSASSDASRCALDDESCSTWSCISPDWHSSVCTAVDRSLAVNNQQVSCRRKIERRRRPNSSNKHCHQSSDVIRGVW